MFEKTKSKQEARTGMTHFVNKKDVRTKKLFVLFTFLANFHLNSLFSQFNNRKTVPIKFRSSRVKHDEGGQCDQMGRLAFQYLDIDSNCPIP